ncbi:MAG: bifunctional phosphoribosylaminoimidazolecarboxamide formyltransferase/IMP cyclohydrolase [Elusimicrobia bacterium]|nr:bifunctional phosphoribosylaminoimidazolecarboxamide formyltransferase/IMP cyclohydrolase [Elusimicrobiota bacterium]
MKRIAVFASGEGTNLQALIDACAQHRIRGQIALVVSNQPQAGALRRAERAGIPVLVSDPAGFSSPEEFDAYLAHACRERKIDLICLAGYMRHIKAPLLRAFPWRILNIHPALLPAFGGQGMYGRRVHEAALKSGVKVSGCTIHFVDEVYDHGPVVAQAVVPVLANDTPESLAARIRVQEHWLYPKAVSLFCEDRLQIDEQGLKVLPSHRDSSPRIKRALLSVSDKSRIVELARGLQEMGVEIVSTSGTARALEAAGVPIRPLDSVTRFPEILSGRVKTLHPNIHGAILLRRKDPAQREEAELYGLEPIDLVVVNLYPFADTAAKASSPWAFEVIEQIDIGGVALIRAAAKNFEDVAVVVSPSDYEALLQEMGAAQGQLSLETRQRLALAAFRHTASYDGMISQAWSSSGGSSAPAAPGEGGRFPERLSLELRKVQDLRYGENPHQRAALYARSPAQGPDFEQLHGKELSYNNLLDASAAWEAACEFQEPAAVIFKHATPCGMATASAPLEAFNAAWACDPLSAFGGVLAFNRGVGTEIARILANRFVEVIIAPGFAPEALDLLKKKPNLRLLKREAPPSPAWVIRSLGTEVLLSEPDRLTFGPDWRVASRRAPNRLEEAALRFAWIACKHVKSNAIVLAGPNATVGIGAGQMSRVDSVHMAGVKYKMFSRDNPKPAALVLGSDAFFPFRDGIDAAATLGITAIVQPGGSVKDGEIVAAADEHGLAMVLTGMRHFRH